MPQRDTLLFGCKAKLRTADIGLNVFFPLAEVRTELGKRKTFRAFWTIVAYRVASGAADAGKNCAGNPTAMDLSASGLLLEKRVYKPAASLINVMRLMSLTSMF